MDEILKKYGENMNNLKSFIDLYKELKKTKKDLKVSSIPDQIPKRMAESFDDEDLLREYYKVHNNILSFVYESKKPYLYIYNAENALFIDSIDSRFYSFSDKEKIDFLLFIIEKNIQLGVIDLLKKKLQNSLRKKYYSHLLKEEFYLFIEQMKKLENKENLSLKEEKDLNYYHLAESRNKEENVNLSIQLIAYEDFKEHYIDKKGEIEETDVSHILEDFFKLGFKEEYFSSYQGILLSQIFRSKKVEEKKQTVVSENFEKVDKKEEIPITKNISPLFDEKKYRSIYREIMKCYDLENHKVITCLSLQDIIYLVHLMVEINIKESEIIKFILKVNKEGLESYRNSYMKLMAYYPKIVLYASEETVSLLNSYLKEMMTKQSNNVDYSFWKENVEETFKKAMQEIKDIYEYEFNEGMNLNKKKKESRKENE